MANITAANVSALMSSVAKHITDRQAQIGSGAAITAGEATTLGKVAALNDAGQQYALLGGFETAMNTEAASLTRLSTYNTILDDYAAACIALEKVCNAANAGNTGGVQAFLVANSIKAPQAYYDAHNRCATISGTVLSIAAAQLDNTIVPAY